MAIQKEDGYMWWTSWVVAGTLFCAYQVIFGAEDKKIRIINQLLGDKGYVKFYDGKSQTFGIELNIGSKFKDLQDLQEVIENAFETTVEITSKNYKYFVQLIEEVEIPTLVPFRLIETVNDQGMRVAVAQGSDDLIYLYFTKVPHTLIAGATGWGKSIFTKNLVLQILSNFPEVEFEFFDFKAGIELGDFKDLKQTKSFIIRPHQAEDEINRIYDEIEQRFAKITANNSRDWMAYNKKSQEKMTPKFVVIEEFTILLDQSKEMSVVLTKCLAIARAVAVFFVFTSQRFDSKIIDSRIKANIDNRVCFHTADGINSKIILDQPGAEQLNVVGRCLISVAGMITEGQTPYVKEKDVQNTVKSHLKTRSKATEDKSINNSTQNKKASNEPKMSDNEGMILWG